MHVLPSAVRKCGAVLMRVYRIQQAQLGILVQLWDKVDADRVATLAAAKRAHDLAAAEAADAEARAAEAEAKKRVRHRAPSKHKKDNKAVVVKSAVSQVKSLEWYKEQVERVPMYVIAVATDGCRTWFVWVWRACAGRWSRLWRVVVLLLTVIILITVVVMVLVVVVVVIVVVVVVTYCCRLICREIKVRVLASDLRNRRMAHMSRLQQHKAKVGGAVVVVVAASTRFPTDVSRVVTPLPRRVCVFVSLQLATPDPEREAALAKEMLRQQMMHQVGSGLAHCCGIVSLGARLVEMGMWMVTLGFSFFGCCCNVTRGRCTCSSLCVQSTCCPHHGHTSSFC